MVGDTGPIAGAAAQPKRMAILALLARVGERGMTRDKILGLLWPDAEEERGRRALANSLSALRRDLDAENVFLGGNDVRLNLDVITSDVLEFETAVAAGQLARAATLYEGPFLDGFRVAGTPEFDRWADAERTALAHSYVTVAEKLASAAEAGGDAAGAVAWWRKLAAHDPLNARHALGLMRALAAAGDRTSALRHGQIYEALVEQELELPPDREVVAFAQRLRLEHTDGPASAGGRARPGGTGPLSPEARQHDSEAEADVGGGAPPPAPAIGGREDGPGVQRPAARRHRVSLALGAGAAAIIAGFAVWNTLRRSGGEPGPSAPVLAVGRISDYRGDSVTDLARPLADMLATNLARGSTIRVVSTARMYELLSRGGRTDTSASAIVSAARAGGATLLVDGALHPMPGGALRLDVQLVELATGGVVAAHTVTGTDALSLADSGTARLVTSLGTAPPAGSVADVTTRSVSAYRLYEQGLREYFGGDRGSARRLFEAALVDDSTFAMAAFYLARSADSWSMAVAQAQRARRLAARTTDRERLKIEAWIAEAMSLPSYAAIAETLAVRYPHDVDGVLHLGRATLADNRPADAMRILERVVAADSVIARDDLLPCSSCEALEMIVHAYQAMDSLSAAIRTIDRWTRLKPRSRAAWQARAAFLTLLGRDAEATEAFERYSTVADVPDAGQLLLAQLHIMGDRFDEADRLLVSLAAAGAPAQRGEAYWFLTLSLRNQGRLEEALEAARAYRRTAPLPDGGHASTLLNAAGEGQVLFESRRYREATALFDSISRLAMPTTLGETARGRVWWLTHAADAFAAQGDTLPLRWIADTVEARGPGSNFHRDRRLHFHVRGLLYAARGHYEDAATQFERARSSPGAGYTRTNYELARLYLRLGRPRDAVTTLQPVLRAGLEGSSYYLTRTETHELLGRSWDAVGDSAARDSAAAHYRRVVQAWSHGDSAFAARANAAAARLAALGR